MIYAWLAVLLWSTVATAFKLALRGLNEVQLLWLASGTATGVLGLAWWGGRRRRTSRPDPEASLWKPSLRLGFLNPFLYYLVLFQAYHRLPAQEALVLNYTWPLVLSVLAALVLRRPFGRRDALALLLGFCGVVVVATRGRLTTLHFADPVGTLLALASAWIWATYWLLNLKDPRPPVPRLFWNFALGFAYTTGILALSPVAWPSLQWRLWIPGVYVGLFEMGITFLVWLQALQKVPDIARASTVVYLTPVLSLFWIRWVLGEPLAPGTVAGLALILAGILLQEFRKPRGEALA